MTKTIVMGVQNEVIDDQRVIKEALALAEKYRVIVLGLNRASHRAPVIPGIEIELIEVESRKTSGSSLDYAKALFEWSRKFARRVIELKADAVHAHDLPVVPAAWWAKRKAGIKLVYDAHELYAETGYAPGSAAAWKMLDRFFLQRADVLFAANDSRAQIMVKDYGAPTLPIALKNLPDASFNEDKSLNFRERCKELGLADRYDTILLYQGAVNTGRRLDFVIRTIPKWNPRVAFVMMGGRDETLINLTRELNLTDRAIFFPKVEVGDVIPLAKEADAGLVIYKTTPRNNYFCAPNKLFDYALAGIPSIGVDLPEVRHFLTKYDAGLLYTPDDENSLVDAINALVSEPERIPQMKSGALRMIQGENWQTEKQKLLEAYRKLFGE